MREGGAVGGGVSASTVLAVVEALYAFADNPAQWHDITAAIEAIGAPLDPTRDPEAKLIMDHAARACRMIDRLNAGRRDRQPGDGPWDALLFSSEGLVRGQGWWWLWTFGGIGRSGKIDPQLHHRLHR